MQIATEKFSIDVQMGIALYPTHAEDGDTLFRRAELALKQAKESGLRFEVYEPDSSGFQKALWKFETELKQAIRFGQLEVYFQPKYSLEQGRVCGAEALVRWRNQIGQLLPAADFIPAAERSGAIVPLTWLVMEQVTKLASSFSAAPRPFSIAVNVPAQALADREFFQRLATVKIELERHQISLIIELTEDSLMQTDSASLEVLNRIRERGVGLAIDDFGKGYSSLNYLRQIPATELKIDREFIRAVALNEKDRHIVKTAIELANAFDMQSVAEGVDSDECVYVLKQLGCSSIQGYFLARPMGVKALQEWFRTKTFDYLHRAATRNAMNISL
jgi:EAL domain-containing protein (putative c-di-GMP-specific phosphodiesterase class I)